MHGWPPKEIDYELAHLPPDARPTGLQCGEVEAMGQHVPITNLQLQEAVEQGAWNVVAREDWSKLPDPALTCGDLTGPKRLRGSTRCTSPAAGVNIPLPRVSLTGVLGTCHPLVRSCVAEPGRV